MLFKRKEVLMKNPRRKFSAEEKVRILRLHLLEGQSISDLCDQHGLTPNIFYRWQKQFFENGVAAFERDGSGKGSQAKKLEQQVSHLQARLAHKDEVIAEIMSSHVALKKSLGEA
jgi:transposase